MTNPKSNKNSLLCILCGESQLNILFRFYSKVLCKFRPVYICRHCGHAQLNPRDSPLTPSELNSLLFTQKYNPALIEGTMKTGIKNLQIHITPHLNHPGGNVLEVGPGLGHLLDFFREKQYTYYFIESDKDFTNSLIRRGGISTADDIFPFKEPLRHKFDLIILRHVLEHLEQPLPALKLLADYLSPAGLLYLAVPNGLSYSSAKGKGYRTDFFRDVHLSYFSNTNIKYVFMQTGLTIIEEWGMCFLLRKGSLNFNWVSEYEKNKRIYYQLSRKAIGLDAKNIVTSKLWNLFR